MSAQPRQSARSFDCFGGRATVIVEGTSAAGRGAGLATVLAQARLQDVHPRLTRFDPGSELSLLNADAGHVVFAGRLLRLLARAVVDAGERSGGLVDATRIGALEQAGYATSRAGVAGLELDDMIAAAPARRPAQPHPARAWASIDVDDDERTIARPPGVRIDSGGLAKGLAADLLAATLAEHPAFAIDCGGDVRIGGSAGTPRAVIVANPFGGPPAHRLQITSGAAATSGIGRRSWRTDGDGPPAHHLIDPATGRPAWTGVVQATAFAPSALEAEVLAKTALLSGPATGRATLEHGGVLILDDGAVHIVDAPVMQAA
ncbi:MAG: FAD:protein transferase [Solirubrobacteraceae bacterium]|nr:FAD:protein transferase [Solirubrobacteraceae bacterium]